MAISKRSSLRGESKNSLQKIGRTNYESVAEMVTELLRAREADDQDAIENAERRIQEDALSVEVREGWHTLDTKGELDEYIVLLGTGGPAIRIWGRLGRYNEPESAELQVQDWGTPWTEYRGADQDTLLAYVSCFYFGEG